MENELFTKVKQIVNEIRPFIQQDGGDIKLSEIKDGSVVVIEFLGACVGCGLLDDYTLRTIQTIIMDEIPEVTDVIEAK